MVTSRTRLTTSWSAGLPERSRRKQTGPAKGPMSGSVSGRRLATGEPIKTSSSFEARESKTANADNITVNTVTFCDLLQERKAVVKSSGRRRVSMAPRDAGRLLGVRSVGKSRIGKSPEGFFFQN